ncbi:MAG TPA: DUF1343 domain-containing protein [Chitinophagaceae bacterium]|jgi:uncharacterized protein YbbC (DUF1343 family)|nr:DUF1343 domain-containing protein [Chitinophagaceae bacterium]
MQQVIPGIDVFIQDPEVNKNSRFAIVTNNAAFISGRILSRLALAEKRFNLVKIFSPEHGISVKGEDGVYQKDAIDIKTALPIISLYGDRLMPTEEDFKDIDIVLFDIPDVGCRFYTYLWTMTYVMEACAKYNKQLIILDRPNPIGGNLEMAEGPILDEKNCTSFIGRWSIPIRHSCTLGELANYFSNKKVKGLDLRIVQVKNWDRDRISNDFYPTSPAIQNISTALVYPGMGLLEGITVNEGRGTDKPFMQFGAPWINAEELQMALKNKNVTGIDLKPCSYIPSDSLYKNETCYGLELNLTDINKFRPVAFGIDLISVLLKLYPQWIKERVYISNANPSGGGHLDKLLGIKNVFEILKDGKTIQTDFSKTWLSEISSFLLYN